MDKQNYLNPSIIDERNQKVVRSVNLIQHAQYTLSLQEQRFLMYCISKVRPNDDEQTVYKIDLRDYLSVCGLSGDTSYDRLKKAIIPTFQKMVFGIETETSTGKRRFTVTNWFDHITVEEKASTVEFMFSHLVAQELIGLAQYNEYADANNKLYYISDELKYMIPFRCRYSYYLYPLLRSYQNRNDWIFPIEELRRQLDVYERLDDVSGYRTVYEDKDKADSLRRPLYPRFVDFRNRVLDPAVADINEFSNIKVSYIPIKKNRSIVAVKFIFENKGKREKLHSEQRGNILLERDSDYIKENAIYVPTVERPLEFAHADDTGDHTHPKSKRITRAQQQEKEARRFSLDQIYCHTAAEYGKRVEHRAPKKEQNVDCGCLFQVELNPNGKLYYLIILRESLEEFAGNTGWKSAQWVAELEISQLVEFITYMIKEKGTSRLSQYYEDGKLQVNQLKESLVLNITGKTPADDMQRLMNKTFSREKSLKDTIADFKRFCKE